MASSAFSLQPVIHLTNDIAGLEKSLRFAQGLCTLAVGLASSKKDAEVYLKAQSQFALTRRYFRLFKWHPFWGNAIGVLASSSPSEKQKASHNPDFILTALQAAKFSLLGLYFFLEMFTITHAMGVTSYGWGPKVQTEANRYWFFGLAVSILVSLYQIVSTPSPSLPTEVTDEKQAARAEKPKTQKKDQTAKPKAQDTSKSGSTAAMTAAWEQLVIDSCDLILPGTALGWITIEPLWIGITFTISTCVAGRQIWRRVQKEQQR